MILHTANSRGHADHGWLKSHHTFSFASYYNPDRVHFGVLRVLNDDWIDKSHGFGMHPHKDMEIISIPLKGTLKHADSMGTNGLIQKGEIQVMSAGTGVFHSEENPREDSAAELLQIWVLPKKLGITPRYDQKKFEFKKNDQTLFVSPDGREGSLAINQDAFFSMQMLDKNLSGNYDLKLAGNGVYIFVIEGKIEVNGQTLNKRDAFAAEKVDHFTLKSLEQSEVLIMEIPMKV